MGATEHDTTAGAQPPAVRVSGITKRFPGVVANEDVHLEVRRGEIHALLGENGAGKSTLSNILTGLYQPDEGHIEIDGRRVAFGSPREANEAGVGLVHQHFRLDPAYTVAENVALGEHGRYRADETEQRVRELSARHGLHVDPTARVWQLSVGEQQRVELLKVLSRGAGVLILDEPTAVLTPQEATALFAALRAFAAEGRAVIFISHKLDEVMSVSDRVTVLRDGRTVGVVETRTTSPRELARLMVGRDVVFHEDDLSERASVDTERPVLEVRGVTTLDDRGQEALRDVSVVVHAGEIVGVCGVAGNGQRELAEVISGTRSARHGEVVVDGRRLRMGDPRDAIRAGVGHIPEDRLHTGLAGGASVEENLVLKSYRSSPVSKGPFLRRRWIRANAERLMERFDVKAPSPATPTRLLSGGNVQKVVLAREFSQEPTVLVAASPTRGLDVGAIETVRHLLLEAARSGVGVLLISEELDEVLALADRIVVLAGGTVVGSVRRGEADIDELGLMMGGRARGTAA
jgi:simple sugar transport system ATP-binding protein